MTSYLNWNWTNEHVQTEIKNGEYVSSESTLVLAGPARMDMLTPANSALVDFSATNSLIPIGLIQGIQVAQNRQLSRLFEIGSKRSYMVPGRMFANFTVSRFLFYGPSLMRLLYALAPIGPGQKLGEFGTELLIDPDEQGQPISFLDTYNDLFPNKNLDVAPGWGGSVGEGGNRDFFVNLTSELFNVPFGMALVFKDTRDRPYGAMYLEDCYIETHNMMVDASTVVMTENVSGQFDRISPIQLSANAGA